MIGDGGVTLWHARAGAAEEPTPWGALALLTAIAVVLRAIGLNGGLWYDEIITLIQSVRSPLYDIVTQFPGNNQHTLFSVLAHLSIQVFGDHAWSLRLPSLVLGALTVPVLYFFAREFTGRTEALLAGLLVATAYHPVWFSQNARGYSALAFLTLLTSWLLMRALRRGRTVDAALYGIAAALGVYAHLTMVFLVVSHALICVAAAARRRADASTTGRWRIMTTAFVLAAVFTLALYSPLLLDVKQFFVDTPTPLPVATPRWAALELIRGLRIGLGAGLGALAAAGLFGVGLWSYLRQSPFIVGLFVLPGLLTVAAAVGLGRPIFPRFLFFLVGFGLLIVVRGALEIGRRLNASRATAIGTALVLAITALSAAALVQNYRYPKQDYEGAMRLVEAERVPGESVVTVGLTTDVYRGYFLRPWRGVATLDELRQERARATRVWVLYTMERYIESSMPDVMRVLREECATAGTFRGTVGGGDVTVCVMPGTGRPLP